MSPNISKHVSATMQATGIRILWPSYSGSGFSRETNFTSMFTAMLVTLLVTKISNSAYLPVYGNISVMTIKFKSSEINRSGARKEVPLIILN